MAFILFHVYFFLSSGLNIFIFWNAVCICIHLLISSRVRFTDSPGWRGPESCGILPEVLRLSCHHVLSSWEITLSIKPPFAVTPMSAHGIQHKDKIMQSLSSHLVYVKPDSTDRTESISLINRNTKWSSDVVLSILEIILPGHFRYSGAKSACINEKPHILTCALLCIAG